MTELPAVDRVGVSPVWHASPAKTSAAVAHLMPKSWSADGRKTRPALCGERRMRWSNADTVHRVLEPCDSCLSEAESRPPSRGLVRIAPAAQRAESIVGRVVEPAQPNSVAERVERRRAFREDLVVLSARAESYLDEQVRRLVERRRAWSVGRITGDQVNLAPVVAEPQTEIEPRDPHAPLLAYSSG